MLERIALENEFNEVLELWGNPNYTLTNVEGLNPPTAVINTSESGLFDGSRYNSSKVGNRNIVLTFTVEAPAEINRIALYRYIKPKRYIKVYVKNGLRDVNISGYVESLEVNPFSNKLMCQVSIICHNPYFVDNAQSIVDFASTVNLFEFPFDAPVEGLTFSEIVTNQIKTIRNMGEIECGALFEINATGSIVEPTVINTDTLERFTLNIELYAGDKLTISTENRTKQVILERNGKKKNVINTIDNISTWLKLAIGINNFTYKTVYGDENLKLKIYHNNMYLGV